MKTIFCSTIVVGFLLMVVPVAQSQVTYISIQQKHSVQGINYKKQPEPHFTRQYNYTLNKLKSFRLANNYKLDSVYCFAYNTLAHPDSFPYNKEINNFNSNGELAFVTYYSIPLGTKNWVPDVKRCFNQGYEFAHYNWETDKGWLIYFKYVRSYNPQTNDSIYETYVTDENYDSVCYNKRVKNRSYILHNEIVTDFYYNFILKQLEIKYKTEYFYNIDFTRYTKIFSYNWDTQHNTWVYGSKSEFDTTENDIISSVKYLYDSVNSTWNKESKGITKLDLNLNKTLTYEYFIFDTTANNWVNNYSNLFSYDRYGKDSIHLFRNYTSGLLQNMSKILYINNQYHCAKYEYTKWDTINGWYGIAKVDSFFNSAGKDTCVIRYSWDTKANNWVYNYKNYGIYNINNNPITFYYQIWDNNNNQWANIEKRNYQYSTTSPNYIEAISAWDTISAAWLLTDKIFYYYSPYTDIVKIQQYSNQLITVYPNPAISNVTLLNNGTNSLIVYIYDTNGRLLSNNKIAVGPNTINVSGLSKGIYIIYINGFAKPIKLVKN
jgi:hypothetical protein